MKTRGGSATADGDDRFDDLCKEMLGDDRFDDFSKEMLGDDKDGRTKKMIYLK